MPPFEWKLARTPSREIHLLGVRLFREPGSVIRVQVALDAGGQLVRSEGQGVGADLVELRLVAHTTIEALRDATGDGAGLRLLGVKRLQAFDGEVVLASLREDHSTTPFLGAVPVDTSLAEGVARAVLHAAACARRAAPRGHQVEAAAPVERVG